MYSLKIFYFSTQIKIQSVSAILERTCGYLVKTPLPEVTTLLISITIDLFLWLEKEHH